MISTNTILILVVLLFVFGFFENSRGTYANGFFAPAALTNILWFILSIAVIVWVLRLLGVPV